MLPALPRSQPAFDVVIVGAGPAGSACAAACAMAGLRTALIDRATFPREKVCGDCLNPAAWTILDRLGVSSEVLRLPHSRLKAVEFIGLDERTLTTPLPVRGRGEIAVSRALLDDVLLRRAQALGVEVHQGTTVTAIRAGWEIDTDAGTFSARHLVAADGRNSTVARLLGLLPAAARDRVGLQSHLQDPGAFTDKVALQFLPWGYAGIADVGAGGLNVCLVGRGQHLDALKAWAAEKFGCSPGHPWRSTTPLSRKAIAPCQGTLLLAGDAARVVEPFTGEGIYYALASGVLAADCIAERRLDDYATAHAALYRGRLWVNRLARLAVLSPRFSSLLLTLARIQPALLRGLTSKVVPGAGTPALSH